MSALVVLCNRLAAISKTLTPCCWAGRTSRKPVNEPDDILKLLPMTEEVVAIRPSNQDSRGAGALKLPTLLGGTCVRWSGAASPPIETAPVTINVQQPQ